MASLAFHCFLFTFYVEITLDFQESCKNIIQIFYKASFRVSYINILGIYARMLTKHILTLYLHFCISMFVCVKSRNPY